MGYIYRENYKNRLLSCLKYENNLNQIMGLQVSLTSKKFLFIFTQNSGFDQEWVFRARSRARPDARRWIFVDVTSPAMQASMVSLPHHLTHRGDPTRGVANGSDRVV